MKHAIRIVDRRADYFRRAADYIAADSLGFYTRAERGRNLQLLLFPEYARREYEREQLLDAAPTTDEPDYESDSRYV